MIGFQRYTRIVHLERGTRSPLFDLSTLCYASPLLPNNPKDAGRLPLLVRIPAHYPFSCSDQGRQSRVLTHTIRDESLSAKHTSRRNHCPSCLLESHQYSTTTIAICTQARSHAPHGAASSRACRPLTHHLKEGSALPSVTGLSAIHFQGSRARWGSCDTLFNGSRLLWLPTHCLNAQTPFRNL